MFNSEKDLRDHVAKLFRRRRFKVTKEFKVPARYRVDLRIEKGNVTSAIEVKFDRKYINDAITKCHVLHEYPEFDHVYVAAPSMIISPDHISFAQRIGVGVLGVHEDSIKYLVKSLTLEPARIGISCNIPKTKFSLDEVFKLHIRVKNNGKKIARNLVATFASGGPFVSLGKKYERHKSVAPEEEWELNFNVRIRKTARLGKYPLYLKCSAENVDHSEMVWNTEIIKL